MDWGAYWPMLASVPISVVTTVLTSKVLWVTGKSERDDADRRAVQRAEAAEAWEAIHKARADTERLRRGIEKVRHGKDESFRYALPDELLAPALVSARLILDDDLRNLVTGGLSAADAVSTQTMPWISGTPSDVQESLLSAVSAILRARLQGNDLPADDAETIREVQTALNEQWEQYLQDQKTKSRHGGTPDA